MSHRLVVTADTTYNQGRSRTIAWRCVDRTCDTAGRVDASPAEVAADVFAAAQRVHDTPDLFTGAGMTG